LVEGCADANRNNSNTARARTTRVSIMLFCRRCAA
jgi:hypothetical protein